jgi:hypothetical protein
MHGDLNVQLFPCGHHKCSIGIGTNFLALEPLLGITLRRFCTKELVICSPE